MYTQNFPEGKFYLKCSYQKMIINIMRRWWVDLRHKFVVMASWVYTYFQTHQQIYIKYMELFICKSYFNKVVFLKKLMTIVPYITKMCYILFLFVFHKQWMVPMVKSIVIVTVESCFSEVEVSGGERCEENIVQSHCFLP